MDKIIILGHENPDVDSIVSGYLLEKILNKKGYNCKFIIPDKIISNDTYELCIKYRIDPSKFMEELDPFTCEVPDAINRIKNAGIVGMGGASFPTHVKLNPPEDKEIEYVLVNAAECEPYLTCDERTLQETPEKVIDGLAICLRLVGARVIIALEDNKVADYESLVMDVPVMLWLNLPIWKLSLGLGAGVNFSTELNRSVEGSAGYVQQIKENQFKMGFVAGADFKIYFTKHLGLVMGGRYIIDFNKTTVPLVGDGDTGIGAVDELERPSIEFTRKNLTGGVGLEFKFF